MMADDDTVGQRLSITTLQRQYLDYLHVKRDEIEEARQARHYYHGDQWTADQIAILKKRKQPVVTSNRINRKIDGVVGLVERLKQDPKAYPRTPRHERGADVATAVLRYSLDASDADAIMPKCARDCAIYGFGGVEIELEPGDRDDIDVTFYDVDPDLFFYDPRSFKQDFSDARYMGVSKWVAEDVAREMFPEMADEISNAMETGAGGAYSQSDDRERVWVNVDKKKLRMVDHWYICGGEWRYAIYVGDLILMEGDSYIRDERGKSISKYIMFSSNVDHDGDRYGFVRHMKSAQDEINARRSKALHYLNARRIIAERGAVQDTEVARRESMRPDGFIEVNPGLKFEFDDVSRANDMLGQLKFLEESKTEIENFGPNPALIGQGVENKSGRAIALLQQAGMAELGPFIIAYKGWKIRLYRALWYTIQAHWRAERWIRVTDDEGLAQFIQVNGIDVDPATGMPALVNALGSLDVDIILDEGPDNHNATMDAYDTLVALSSQGERLPPGLLIELAPGIPSNIKKKYLDKIAAAAQPDPVKNQAQGVAMQQAMADVAETKSKAFKNVIDAAAKAASVPDRSAMGQPMPMAYDAMGQEQQFMGS